MKKQIYFPRKIQSKSIISLIIVLVIVLGAILPAVQATNIKYYNGFDKGPSFKPVLPLKKITLVGFDEESYLDDYAYLAAIPTAVINDDEKIISHPLLYYQDKLEYDDDKYRSLDPYPGIKNFMDDYSQYCNNQLDQMTLINVPKNKVEEWSSNNYTIIKNNDPYKIANALALQDWSYSDDAVIAVIDEEFKKPDNSIFSTLNGTIPADKKILEKQFITESLNKLNPRFHEFEIPKGYKYLKSRTWWPSIWIGKGGNSDFPIHINITIPAADADSQLYCKYNGDWMQVAATAGWNLMGMDIEKAETYVYTSGQWRLGITDVPTKGILPIGTNGNILEILKSFLTGIKYTTDITIYPGIEKKLEVNPPFGCRDATFKLTWNDPGAKIGFSLIGPAGEEIITASEDNTHQEIHVDQLGECPSGKSYSISVFSLENINRPIDFTVEYNWQQNHSKIEADSLTSATEGAVLASILNAPLLYTSKSKISDETKNVLYKLGVENIHLVNFGGHLAKSVKEEIKDIAKIKNNYQKPEKIYEAIMKLTNRNDIIFSTIDPWTKWYVGERKPADETKASLFIGPAAYCAAHHGSPVIIIDNHPELSSAVVWHNEFWKHNANGMHEPTVSEMYLTGSQVIEFLNNLNFDKEGQETMITVAGQFDIGATWDRAFTGKARPGRIFGSPVDTAYWISHNMFYPALIFNNPGMDKSGNELLQGSSSHRSKLFPWGSIGLKIDEEPEEKIFKYPVLETYVCYNHRFNEMAEKYYGFKYKCADDIVPGVTESNEPIDEGVVPGNKGAIWPDMSETEVVPFYLKKGGYDSVFSTSFSAITDNLNGGVLLWFSGTHGSGARSGELLTWGPEESPFGMLPKILRNRLGYQKDENPWRGYEWYLGSTENPDTMTMECHGFIPALLGNPNIQGMFPTGEDFWPSERPILHSLANLPIIKHFLPEWLKNSDYYKDGMVIAHTFTTLSTSLSSLTGYTLDDALENIYSCGWINSACLPAYKYLHLTMVRHGSPFQVIDPWKTSWYSGFWTQTIPRDIILGDTIGEAYTKGIGHVGILYVTDPPQWWWDISENVCFFGDPDQRVFVPETTYSSINNWKQEETKPYPYDETLSVKGHMPFGATSYPHEKEPKLVLVVLIEYLWLIILIITIIIGLIIIKNKKPRKK